MSLAPGSRLGPYEITGVIGAGGMGTVYRCTDTRLRRSVAIKVLQPQLAHDDAFRRRFEREARSAAQLSHPNVCALFDVGAEGDTAYLVMELLDGETLAARQARGPLLREEILSWAAEIAGALAAAHARGVVHRDLKPANVMITPSGIKLLDFGLARALPETSDGFLAQTMTAPITIVEEGRLLGTLPYMAPEQLEGRPADARSDVFAFGAVLYEMATGRRAFEGSSSAAVTAAILAQEPPSLRALEARLPPLFATVVRRCLAKDPYARWQSARDLELLLRDSSQQEGLGAPVATGEVARRSGLPWAVAAAALLALGAVLLIPRGFGSRSAPPTAVRFTMPPPAGISFRYFVEGQSFAVSPDGKSIAFVCSEEERPGTFVAVRELGSLELRRLPGTENANSVFWSPDGRTLAFFSGTVLKRVQLAGGAPVPICEVPEGGQKYGSWGSEGEILFSPVQGTAIFRVPASGGEPEVALAADTTETTWRVNWPTHLPDGRSFLYVAGLGTGGGKLRISSPGSAPRDLMECTSKVQFTDPDLLVFVKEGTLFGQRFDLRADRLKGGPFPLADSVAFFLSTGNAQFSTSRGGTLAYQPASDTWRLAWFDRRGRELGTAGSPGRYFDVRFSDDGGTLWFARARDGIGTYDIWTLDLARGVESRVTSGLGSEFAPVPAPAIRSVFYAEAIQGTPQVMRRDLSTEETVRVFPSAGFQIPRGVTPDAGTLLFVERTEERNFAPEVLRLGGGDSPQLLLPPGVFAGSCALSPDGRHAAVVSNETGSFELYVVPFPGPGPRQRVSKSGATFVKWSGDGNELFYLTPGEGLLATPISTAGAVRVGEATVLVPRAVTKDWQSFDVTPDGERILAIVPQVDAERLPITVVVNWPAGIRE